ncbi:MAG TPA: YhjD/YihY/BrkB family envelope integrity protein [Burkholderiaceae bacterium]
MEIWKLLLRSSAPAPLDGALHWRRPVHGVIVGVKVIWDALFAFVTEEALIRASSLAFTSILALVPLMTVGLRVMNFYGVSDATREQFEAVLAQYLLPAQSRDVVNLMLSAASQVTQNIGALGLAGFCVTLVLMARELEGHILKICGARSSLTTSLLHYAAFLVLAPTGALLAFALLHPLAALLSLLPGGLASVNYPFVLSMVVLFVTLRAFSGYVLSWRASAFGAIAAAVAAWGSWRGCALYFSHSVSLSAYGALASIPAFLLWVFVAWCCVLFGVQVAAKAQPLCPQGRGARAGAGEPGRPAK